MCSFTISNSDSEHANTSTKETLLIILVALVRGGNKYYYWVLSTLCTSSLKLRIKYIPISNSCDIFSTVTILA